MIVYLVFTCLKRKVIDILKEEHNTQPVSCAVAVLISDFHKHKNDIEAILKPVRHFKTSKCSTYLRTSENSIG